MKYDSELESWMKTFYASLSPPEQRRYAVVEALKFDDDTEGIQYIVDLLGCDAEELDRARQEFADGEVKRVPAETAGELGGVAAGFGAAAEADAAEDADTFNFAAADAETDDTAAADSEDAAAFWQEDGDADGDDQAFGGFGGEEASEEDGQAASAVLEAAGTTTTKRKSKKGPGPIANVLGIVLFGLIGIVAGYVILIFVAEDRAMQLFDYKQAWKQVASVWSSEQEEEPVAPEGKPSDPDTGFEPGGMLDDEEKDADNFIKEPPPEENGGGELITEDDPFGDGGNPFAGGNGDPTDDPELAIDEPETMPEDDPLAIDVPEINGFDPLDPGIDDPLTLPDTGSTLVQPATEQRYSIDEIDESIDDVTSLADDPDVKFSKIYLSLCTVGDRLAKPTLEAETETAERVAALENYFESVGDDKSKLATIGNFSHEMLFSGNRPADKTGALVLGQITSLEDIASGHKAKLVLADPKKRGKQVTVVSGDVARHQVGDIVFVLGTIITDPATELKNYDGDESLLIYPAMVKKL